VVGHEDRRARGGDAVDALDVEAHPGQQLGPHQRLHEALRLDAEHRDLGHARGYVEVDHRPAAQQREAHHAGVGVDRDRLSHGAE
jgi:hypothetical protein